VVALIFFLPRDTDSKKDAKKTQEDVTETPPTDDETTDNPMQTQLENGQYAELIDTLLTIEDLEFYGDEENMREYMRQALAGHMSAAINEAQQLASAGDFDGAFGKIESELAYRDNLKGQGRVHPLTEDSSELESAREQLNSQYGEYVSKNVQARAEQKDLAGMESLLGQASGRLSEEQYNKISVDAYYLYVIKMVDQMQGEGQDPYAIMDFIDSYFERTNYHGYLMELWDNQNAQSGRVSTWNASVSHADSNGYLLYNSEGRNISKSELGNFTQYELYLARWEIYARHNRIFVDNALNTYFSKYGWYNGTVDFLAFDDSSLNEYEKGNIKTIIEYEKECGYR
ncbi:MAG: YARHG domain-containing protein, partial [Lachnospiraceae bacterium]|nr:YARHG domain-containing protein [Lachnospiraceae bacterium]